MARPGPVLNPCCVPGIVLMLLQSLQPLRRRGVHTARSGDGPRATHTQAVVVQAGAWPVEGGVRAAVPPKDPPARAKGRGADTAPPLGRAAQGPREASARPSLPLSVHPARVLRPSGLTRLASPILPPPFAAALLPRALGVPPAPLSLPSLSTAPRPGPAPFPVALLPLRPRELEPAGTSSPACGLLGSQEPGRPREPPAPRKPEGLGIGGGGRGCCWRTLRPVRGEAGEAQWDGVAGPGEGDGPGRRQP